MYKYYTFNNDIQVGDFVTSGHHMIFKVTKIEKRFISQNDIQKYPSVYGECVAGDERNPLLSLFPIFALGFMIDPDEKIKPRIKILDGGFVLKINKDTLNQYISRLEDIKNTLFLL